MDQDEQSPPEGTKLRWDMSDLIAIVGCCLRFGSLSCYDVPFSRTHHFVTPPDAYTTRRSSDERQTPIYLRRLQSRSNHTTPRLRK